MFSITAGRTQYKVCKSKEQQCDVDRTNFLPPFLNHVYISASSLVNNDNYISIFGHGNDITFYGKHGKMRIKYKIYIKHLKVIARNWEL